MCLMTVCMGWQCPMVSLSHVPWVTLLQGVPYQCIMGWHTLPPPCALLPRAIGDTSTMPHRGVMGGTALQYPIPICNWEMQPHSALYPCAMSGTAPWCPTPMGDCPTVLHMSLVVCPVVSHSCVHCPMLLHAPIPWAGTSSQCPTAVRPMPVAGGWHCPTVPHAPSLGRVTTL